MTYNYRQERGFIASVMPTAHTFTGRQLRAFFQREFPEIDTLRAAKRFTRMALKPYLGGRPLKAKHSFGNFNSPHLRRKSEQHCPIFRDYL